MSTAEDLNKIDRYQLINCLAQGTHTQVWEVTDGAQRVAMKLLLPDHFKDSVQRLALKTEFQIGKTFDHPNVIKYHDLVINRQHGYFTMELFRAPNLKSQIYSDLKGVQIRLKRVVELVCLALEHVHEKGWIHKDIKPDNILLNKASEIRLIDFSLGAKAKGALAKLFSRKQKVVQGTRSYMSPEQIMARTITTATDQYSFGITLFECLTGQVPFKGSTPKDLLVRHMNEKPPAPSFFNPNVTPEMDRLVLRLLEKKAEKRFKTMTEFLLEFRRVNVFKESVEEVAGRADEKQAAMELGERRDSRSDALRQSTPQVVMPTQPGKPVPAAPARPAAAPVNPAVAQATRPPAQTQPAARPAPAAAQPANRPAPAPATPAVRPAPAAAQPGRGQPAAAATRPLAAPAPSPRTAQPQQPADSVAARAPVPARPALSRTPPKPKPEESMNIEDLPSFDELPPVL